MMTEELGLSPTGRSEFHAAFATFSAFVAIGFLLLSVFVYDAATPGDAANTLGWSAVMTAGAFVVVGAVKARFVDQPWWRSALETLAVGGTAAVLAYAAGALPAAGLTGTSGGDPLPSGSGVAAAVPGFAARCCRSRTGCGHGGFRS